VHHVGSFVWSIVVCSEIQKEHEDALYGKM